MSSREKNLLMFFAVAGFFILNLLGFKYYTAQRQSVDSKRKDAELKLANAENFRTMSSELSADMEWLAANEPEPAAFQDVQSRLQQFGEQEAATARLTIKKQQPLETDTTGAFFHRAKFQFNLVGSEQGLYQWFDRINVPSEFRAVTLIRLGPDREDDTLIDCTAIIEQWFVPIAPEL
jgi:hypothetical protein